MSDLINRSALLEEIEATVCFSVRGYDAASAAVRGAQKVLDRIKAAPAVDAVEVVHGRWIHDINNLYGCFVCGERETMSHKKLKNYCPNCGAKMDGERNDNG